MAQATFGKEAAMRLRNLTGRTEEHSEDRETEGRSNGGHTLQYCSNKNYVASHVVCNLTNHSSPISPKHQISGRSARTPGSVVDSKNEISPEIDVIKKHEIHKFSLAGCNSERNLDYTRSTVRNSLKLALNANQKKPRGTPGDVHSHSNANLRTLKHLTTSAALKKRENAQEDALTAKRHRESHLRGSTDKTEAGFKCDIGERDRLLHRPKTTQTKDTETNEV